MRRSGNVEVFRLAAQHQIAHAATNQVGDMVRVYQPIQYLEHVAVDIATRYRMLRPFQRQWFQSQFYELSLNHRRRRFLCDFTVNLTSLFDRGTHQKSGRVAKPTIRAEESLRFWRTVLAIESSPAFGFGSVCIFFRWPLRQEAVSVIRFLPSSIVRIPHIREMHDRARLGNCLKCLHCLAHNLALEVRLMWFASLMAKRKIEKHCARRINRLRNIEGRGHAERRDSGRFDHSRNQSNGLMTHWSGGHQVECVHMSTFELVDDFRG
jgi:hypothetical protein